MEPSPARAAEIRARLEAYLQGKDFHFNPDPETVDGIIRAMAMRHERLGKDYCPCRRVTGNPETDDKNVCPCVYHLDELNRDGYCHCRLFYKDITKPEA